MRCSLFLSALIISAAALPSEVTAEPHQADPVTKAVAVLSGNSSVTGIVVFAQLCCGQVTVTGLIQGLDPNSRRGFHVHTYGDLTGGCDSAGAHFNPDDHTHGGRHSEIRHAGDLGNIQSDENGVAAFKFVDDYLSLNGRYGIVGRSIVVHAGTDDLGKGGQPDSLTTGHSGARSACGVIGLAPDA